MNRRVLELYEQLFDNFRDYVKIELEGTKITVWPLKGRLSGRKLKKILELVEKSGARSELVSFGNLNITFPVKKEDVHEIRC